MHAGHTNLISMSAYPIHPLRWWLIIPPWTQACMLREIYNGHVWATSTITRWMTSLVRWTKNLVAIEMACCRCWLHAEIELPVHSALPTTCAAIKLTRDIKAAIDLLGLLLIARLWTNTSIHCNESAAIPVWLTALIAFQRSFGIQAPQLQWKTRELFLAEHTVVVVVKGNEERL